MKNIKLISLVLISISTLNLKCQTVVLKNEIFYKDTLISAKKIVFKKDALIKIKNASVITFLADTLEVETTCLIDGRGENGANGVQPTLWESGEKTQWIDLRHEQWTKAGFGGYDNGTPGQPGTPGAKVTIIYKVRSGISGSLAGLVSKTDGGKGGEGSEGRILRCGECKKTKIGGNRGTNGADGANGFYHIINN